jgi:hypothetical protein
MSMKFEGDEGPCPSFDGDEQARLNCALPKGEYWPLPKGEH